MYELFELFILYSSIKTFSCSDNLYFIIYLGDGGLRVEYEVAKCPLENPSELREEAGGVGDGSEGSSSDHLLSLDDPL